MRIKVFAFAALLKLTRFLSSYAFQTSVYPKKRWPQNGAPKGTREDRPTSLFLSSSSRQSPYQVTLEYCTGCRWGLRSFWMAQELLNTFNDEPGLEAVTLLPSRPPAPGGEFVVQCHWKEGNQDQVETMTLWNRKENGGFPEITELKQLVRDRIDPSISLGHSDTKDRRVSPKASEKEPTTTQPWTVDAASVSIPPALHNASKPNVSISYCTGCRWLLRAAWYAQELSATFEKEISSISLIPCRPPTKGGTFIISVDGKVVWDRADQERFPKITEIKQVIRDVIDPSKQLGHSDNKPSLVQEMSEDEAEEARKFFGVQ